MPSTILINEFLPNPIGTDKGNEWIEIVNVSENEIDLSNWEIQVAGIKFNKAFKFPTGSKILPGKYLLLCEEFVKSCNYYTSLLAIQNGGKETDGVRILNEKFEVIDTVLYDTTNSNNLLNNFGDIEKDENIVEMPGEGCSLARRNFSDTNFSIRDFFITCLPTLGKPNFELNSIIISEVSFDFIEFYSANIPSNLESWYIKNGNEKLFLKNNFKNNFFFLQTQKPLNNISLHSPDNILVDSFFTKRISKNFSFCRLNSKFDEEFSLCEITKEEKNELKNWKHLNLLEIIQLGKKDFYIVKPCVMYSYKNLYIISDQTGALGVKCESCEIDKCFLSELNFKKETISELELIQNSDFVNINTETINTTNYLSLFNKVVIVKGKFTNSNEEYSYFSTDIGLVKIEKGQYFENNEYTFKGILEKENEKDMSLRLEYAVLVKQQSTEILSTLEQTGDPLIYLLFLCIFPFIFCKIFVKLSTIKFKRTIV